jgi:TatA/E family protein of Tat protein translocase
MGPFGVQEMFAVVVLALLLFGPKKLPELARLLGKGLTEFRRAKNELKSTFETHLSELDREVRASEYQTKQINSTSTYTPSSYSYPYEDNAPYEPPVTDEIAGVNDVPPVEIAAEQIPSVQAGPVPEGTVARVNGTRHVEPPVSIATEEERSA